MGMCHTGDTGHRMLCVWLLLLVFRRGVGVSPGLSADTGAPGDSAPPALVLLTPHAHTGPCPSRLCARLCCLLYRLSCLPLSCDCCGHVYVCVCAPLPACSMSDMLPRCAESGISVKYGRKVLQRLQAVGPARRALVAALAAGPPGPGLNELEEVLGAARVCRCLLEEDLLQVRRGGVWGVWGGGCCLWGGGGGVYGVGGLLQVRRGRVLVGWGKGREGLLPMGVGKGVYGVGGWRARWRRSCCWGGGRDR